MGATEFYNWPIPDLGEDPDGPEAFEELAIAQEATILDDTWTSFTPNFTASGASDSLGTRAGLYRVEKGWCDFSAYIGFGSTVNGGSGAISVNIPVVPSRNISEQWMLFRLWVPGVGSFPGLIFLNPSTNLDAIPWVPRNTNDSFTNPLANRTAVGGAGSGTPTIPGTYTILPAGALIYGGRYQVA